MKNIRETQRTHWNVRTLPVKWKYHLQNKHTSHKKSHKNVTIGATLMNQGLDMAVPLTESR